MRSKLSILIIIVALFCLTVNSIGNSHRAAKRKPSYNQKSYHGPPRLLVQT